MSGPIKLLCAVYTRKSTEEGLDQEFNSLDAQREACEAFITSQASLGWKLVADHYDDGGISGGTMDRPALQRLLQDIRERRVEVVVVYKIDRLTRSLTDFSKIVEVFDGHGVSFVSVTQQFNTTTSMGRLTLNVLLSFAQFEREVAAERIRDKIAASKKRGMWMGGSTPIGYRNENKKLIPDPATAEVVRSVFDRYLEVKSVPALARELRAGSTSGKGAGWTKGKLYYLLSNPVYVGRVRHGKLVYEGEHQAIVAPETFDQAQALLADNAPIRVAETNVSGNHLLTGILFDEAGNRLSPVFTTNHGKRYRYYVDASEDEPSKSSGRRIPAERLERAVIAGLSNFVSNRPELARMLQEQGVTPGGLERALTDAEKIGSQLSEAKEPAKYGRIARLLHGVVIADRQIHLTIDAGKLVRLVVGEDATAQQLAMVPELDAPSTYVISFGMSIRRRGGEARVVVNSSPAAESDPLLVDLIGRSHYLLRRLTDGTGMSMAGLAKETGIHIADISRILRLAFLSPKLTDAILTGRQPAELTARRLSRVDLPRQWDGQAGAFAD